MEMVVITKEDLLSMIKEAVKNALPGIDNPPPPETEDLITIDQASKLLHYSKATIYSMISRSEIPSMKKGRRVYFLKSELLEWLKGSKRRTRKEIENDLDKELQEKK